MRRAPARSIPLLSWLLAACVVFAGITAARAADVPVVAQEQLQSRLAAKDPQVVVLDVRTPEEFAAGHVPGAINVPHDQVEARIAELRGARDRDLVVYCRSGKRAGVALETLGRLGFTRLAHLEGDWLAWESAGLPAERPALLAPTSKIPPAAVTAAPGAAASQGPAAPAVPTPAPKN